MTRIAASVLLSGCLAASSAWAGLNKQAGTSGSSFLKLGAGARAGAMADSFSAIADDAYAIYYNPAGLTQLKGTQIGGAHTAYIMGLNYEVFQFAVPFGRRKGYSKHAFGIGLYHLSVDDIERRVSDTDESIGTFGAYDGAYAVSYAYAMNRSLSLGVTAKYISLNLDTYHAGAVAADAGALYTLNPDATRPISVSVVVRHAGTRPSFAGGASAPLPLSLTGGLGVRMIPERLKLNVEMTKYRDTDPIGSIGGEYVQPFSQNVAGAYRFGYSSQRKDNPGLSGIATGAGIRYYRAHFDFAWIPFGSIGNTYRYSLLIKF